MKCLGINFSYRKNGNCANCVKYCLSRLEKDLHNTEAINIFDYSISSCSNCNYDCFYNSKCPIDDGFNKLVDKCTEADTIIMALPTYRGHLPSSYFAFSERFEGTINGKYDYEEDFLKKVNMVIIGNLSSGGDMALHEALCDFSNRPFYPETILLSSRDYSRKSIYGDLIEDDLIRGRLDTFVGKVLNRSK